MYDDDVTVHEVLIQYEDRVRQLQACVEQIRLPHALAASFLIIALALCLALSFYAIRGQLSLLWPSLPITPIGEARRGRRVHLRLARVVVIDWDVRNTLGRCCYHAVRSAVRSPN